MADLDLHAARVKFTFYASKIPTQAQALGLECFREEAKRAPVAAAANGLSHDQKAEAAILLHDRFPVLSQAILTSGVGITLSLHTLGLAEDYTLFRGGQLAPPTDYEALGMWWEDLGKQDSVPLAWGGRFKDPDHFSWAWGGRK